MASNLIAMAYNLMARSCPLLNSWHGQNQAALDPIAVTGRLLDPHEVHRGTHFAAELRTGAVHRWSVSFLPDFYFSSIDLRVKTTTSPLFSECLYDPNARSPSSPSSPSSPNTPGPVRSASVRARWPHVHQEPLVRGEDGLMAILQEKTP